VPPGVTPVWIVGGKGIGGGASDTIVDAMDGGVAGGAGGKRGGRFGRWARGGAGILGALLGGLGGGALGGWIGGLFGEGGAEIGGAVGGVAGSYGAMALAKWLLPVAGKWLMSAGSAALGAITGATVAAAAGVGAVGVASYGIGAVLDKRLGVSDRLAQIGASERRMEAETQGVVAQITRNQARQEVIAKRIAFLESAGLAHGVALHQAEQEIVYGARRMSLDEIRPGASGSGPSPLAVQEALDAQVESQRLLAADWEELKNILFGPKPEDKRAPENVFRIYIGSRELHDVVVEEEHANNARRGTT
jgi:hypothetical protein